MALSGRVIRGRIKSVKNTKKITKAMELVSAAKMRRSVNAALQSRVYAQYAWDLLVRLRAGGDEDLQHPLLVQRAVKKILVVAITSNRGLAGAFTSNIIKKVAQQISRAHDVGVLRDGTKRIEPAVENPEMDFVIVGKRGESLIRKVTNRVIASFVDVPDVPRFEHASPIIRLATDAYARREYDKVVVVYTHYVSALVQKTKIRQLLPVSAHDLEKTLFPDAVESVPATAPAGQEAKANAAIERAATFEPSRAAIISEAVTRLIESQVFQAILESSASEHSARMMSMRQATDAATDMIDNLTLVFNQARQASITKEISEISAGKAALE